MSDKIPRERWRFNFEIEGGRLIHGVASSTGDTMYVYMEGNLSDMLERLPLCAGMLAKSVKDKMAEEQEEE